MNTTWRNETEPNQCRGRNEPRAQSTSPRKPKGHEFHEFHFWEGQARNVCGKVSALGLSASTSFRLPPFASLHSNFFLLFVYLLLNLSCDSRLNVPSHTLAHLRFPYISGDTDDRVRLHWIRLLSIVFDYIGLIWIGSGFLFCLFSLADPRQFTTQTNKISSSSSRSHFTPLGIMQQ